MMLVLQMKVLLSCEQDVGAPREETIRIAAATYAVE